jgi:hypothetical protein
LIVAELEDDSVLAPGAGPERRNENPRTGSIVAELEDDFVLVP